MPGQTVPAVRLSYRTNCPPGTRMVPDAECRVFLEKRFLGKMRAKDIANERHYNENWAMTEQRKALGMIEPILRKKGIIDQDF